MGNWRIIKIVLGFIFIFLGIFFMIVDRYFCSYQVNEEFVLCIKLFLFVGLIFVVCGTALLVRRNIPFEFERGFNE